MGGTRRRAIERSVFAAALIASSLIASNGQATVTPLYFVGDSLADAGNHALLVDSNSFPGFPAGSRTTTPIPNSAFIPTLPCESNRYSNGPVWAEQFASALGSSVHANPNAFGLTNFTSACAVDADCITDDTGCSSGTAFTQRR